MITKGEWKVNAEVKSCIESEQGLFLETIGHISLWSQSHVDHMLACVNSCRGLDTKELQERGIVGAVGNQLLKQDEIIEKLITLVEHYGNCYNHDLTAYHEYRVAKKYLDKKESLND